MLGVIGYFWCAALFIPAQGTPAPPISPPKTAVVSGLYRINRNPLYSSVLAAVYGQALFYRQSSLLMYSRFLALCFHWFVTLYEEPNLRARFDGEHESSAGGWRDGFLDSMAGLAADSGWPVESCLHDTDTGFCFAAPV